MVPGMAHSPRLRGSNVSSEASLGEWRSEEVVRRFFLQPQAILSLNLNTQRSRGLLTAAASASAAAAAAAVMAATAISAKLKINNKHVARVEENKKER